MHVFLAQDGITNSTCVVGESIDVVFLVTVILPTSTCDPYINDACIYCALSTDLFMLCYTFK